jgi:hypothetical protein
VALLKNINFAILKKLVVLTSLFGLHATITQLDKSCAKEGLFLCFIQQYPQRVVLATIFIVRFGERYGLGEKMNMKGRPI